MVTSDAGQPILPITNADGLRLDINAARKIGESLRESYTTASPFPHIIMDNFLPDDLANTILNNFPHDPHEHDLNFEAGYSGYHKRLIQPIDCKEFVRNLFYFFNSEPMIQFLEKMTGISGLIPDPYFQGGGFHEISTGGLLGVHTDFRINEQLLLERRMNLLIYLNPEWQTLWGGQLGLWDPEMKNEIQKIDPLFNRAVVFNTDAASYHGHPDPLACPPDVKRRSIALYYYTASKNILNELPANSTIYVPRSHEKFADRYEAWRVRMFSYLKDWLPPVAFRALRRILSR